MRKTRNAESLTLTTEDVGNLILYAASHEPREDAPDTLLALHYKCRGATSWDGSTIQTPRFRVVNCG